MRVVLASACAMTSGGMSARRVARSFQAVKENPECARSDYRWSS